MITTPEFAQEMKRQNNMLKYFPNGIGLWGEMPKEKIDTIADEIDMGTDWRKEWEKEAKKEEFLSLYPEIRDYLEGVIDGLEMTDEKWLTLEEAEELLESLEPERKHGLYVFCQLLIIIGTILLGYAIVKGLIYFFTKG